MGTHIVFFKKNKPVLKENHLLSPFISRREGIKLSIRK
jgi:hypothetical protein